MQKCITFYGVSSARFILANSRVVGWLGLMFAFLWQRHHPHNQHHHHPQRPIFGVIIIVQCSFYCGEVLLASTATPASLPPAAPQNIQKQKKEKSSGWKKKESNVRPQKQIKLYHLGKPCAFIDLPWMCGWCACIWVMKRLASTLTHTHTHTHTSSALFFHSFFFASCQLFP